jgi:TPR repeat protein
MRDLAFACGSGKHGTKKKAEAKKWLLKAVEANNVQAQYHLAE